MTEEAGWRQRFRQWLRQRYRGDRWLFENARRSHHENDVVSPPIPNRVPEANAELVLNSADQHLNFAVRVFVGYAWAGHGAAPPSPFEIARIGIRDRANAVSQNRTLAECRELHGELETALHRPGLVSDTGVRAWAHCVEVDAESDLIEAVRARYRSQQRQVIDGWHFEQRDREEQRFRELITEPLRATAWWFSQHQDRPEDLPKVARDFQALRTTLSPEPHEPRAPDELAAAVTDFVAEAEAGERNYLAHHLMRVFDCYQRSELVERVSKTCE